MAEIVNLNHARKARARSEAKRIADGNAAKFGRSRPEKTRDKAETERRDRDLDAHRIDDGPDSDAP